MLGLKASTSPEWAQIVLKDLGTFLTDHAYNEMKAAQSAMAVINHWPENIEFVKTMSALAIEEMEHFEMVYEQMNKYGFILGEEQVNEYAMKLRKFFPKTKNSNEKFVQKLLMSSLIEARSCERFSVLKEELKQDYPELAQFYSDLFESEARHYRVFLQYAREYAGKEKVNKIWNELLSFEAGLINELGRKATVHG